MKKIPAVQTALQKKQTFRTRTKTQDIQLSTSPLGKRKQNADLSSISSVASEKAEIDRNASPMKVEKKISISDVTSVISEVSVKSETSSQVAKKLSIKRSNSILFNKNNINDEIRIRLR